MDEIESDLFLIYLYQIKLKKFFGLVRNDAEIILHF